jgi:uncharacterized membrane protein YcgQ (UPF0703/DUF1980 family)
MAASEIPVYIVTGFLEAGKTMFLQQTLEGDQFDDNIPTLLLVCEEGVEEYDPSRFKNKKVYMETLDDVSELTTHRLNDLLRRRKAERVMIEYNGMWPLTQLIDNLPEAWVIYQQIVFADSTTFVNYNANMRSLVVDKLTNTNLIVFNRVVAGMDTMPLHKIVRALNRMTDIAYENTAGEVQYDEIVDPLPFDVQAPVITVEDRDFALWYADLFDHPKTYKNKIVRIKMVAAFQPGLPDRSVFFGRHVMTCCEADIAYKALLCKFPAMVVEPRSYEWFVVQGKIVMERVPGVYRGTGPVLHATSLEPCDPPEQKVATFY